MSPIALAVIGGISTNLELIRPLGTQPNDITLSTGKGSTGKMIKAGIMLDVGAFTIIMLAYFFSGPEINAILSLTLKRQKHRGI